MTQLIEDTCPERSNKVGLPMTWGGICKIIVVGVYLFYDRYIDKSKNLFCFVHAAVPRLYYSYERMQENDL